MNKTTIALCFTVLLAACGESKPPAATPGAAADKKPAAAAPKPAAAAGDKLALKSGGKDLSMEVKSGLLQPSEQTASDPKNAHAKYRFALANYDLNASPGETSKTLSNPGDVRVHFILIGPAGSNKETPLAPGTYATEGGWPKFDNSQYAIISVADGKQVVAMGQDLPDKETTGMVKIASVEGDTIKGEIDIKTADKHAMKGSFTAKLKK
jgi:hypothetical protein